MQGAQQPAQQPGQFTAEQARAELARRQEVANPTKALEELTTPTVRQRPFTSRGGDPIGLRPNASDFAPDTDPRDVAPESAQGRRASAKARGVDYETGGDIRDRFQTAIAPNIPRLQAQAQPFLKVDEDSGDLLFARIINEGDVKAGKEPEENIGKIRWTAYDAEGLEPGDIGDLFDLPEVGSVVGAVAALGFSKNPANLMSFGKATGLQAKAGLAGRELGNAIEILQHGVRTGEWPTKGELALRGMKDVAIEYIMAAAGEFASRKVIDPAVRKVQKVAGRLGLKETQATARESADVADAINDGVDVQKDPTFEVSIGEASDDTAQILKEQGDVAAAAPVVQQVERLRQRNQKEAMVNHINRKLEGTTSGDPSNLIREVNTTIQNGSEIRIGKTNIDGDETIWVFPGAGSGVEGIRIKDRGGKWQVERTELNELQGIGFAPEMYRAAVEAAENHGTALQSDRQLTSKVVSLWEDMEKDGVAKFRWNVDRTNADNWYKDEHGVEHLLSDSGRPVVEVIPEEGLARQFINKDNWVRYSPPDAVGANSKSLTKWEDFLRSAPDSVVGQVAREIRDNPYLKEDVMRELWEPYALRVFKKGADGKENFSLAAHKAFFEDNHKSLSKLFSPAELDLLHTAGGWRSEMNKLAARNAQSREVLNETLRLDSNSLVLRDNNQLLKQLRTLHGKDRPRLKRAMRVLEQSNPGQFRALQNEMRGDVASTLRSKVWGNASKQGDESFDRWVKNNHQWLGDVFGDQYVKDIRTVQQAYNISARRYGLKGVPPEATPAPLALFRAVFGPLSRKQRGISAVRRVQTRRIGEHAIDVISDPAVLRQLVEITEMPIPTRQGVAIAMRPIFDRIGTHNALGTDDPEEVARMIRDYIAESVSAEAEVE